MRKTALAAAVIGLLVAPALAQAPPAGPPTPVRGTIEQVDGHNLIVRTRERPVVTVAPETPIVIYVPGDPALLKPSAAVTIFAQKKPDGSLTAARVTVEKDGVKPPM